MPKISEKSHAKYQSLLRGGSPQSPEKRPVTTETTSSSKRRRIDVEESNIGGNDTRELLEKIYRQNSQMAAKLDEILAKQKALEERMDRMEVDLEESNVDEAFANVIKFYIYITKLVCLLIFFNLF
jgi:primase-polymerase (primpol)-like protein